MIEALLFATGVVLPIALLMYDMIVTKKRLDMLETEVTNLRVAMINNGAKKEDEKPSKGDEAYNILRTNAKRIGLSHCFK
jgi:hypothetical protein